MSKVLRDVGVVKSDSAPYSVADRKKKSRIMAKKRRTTYKSVMDDLTQALPFPKDVVSQLDYNSRLRLSLCFFRLKNLLASADPEATVELGGGENGVDNGVRSQGSTECREVVRHELVQPGMLQSMMAEALDGFLLVASSEGTIVYLSESIHYHLGIFQSEHIGINVYDIISEDDHEVVREAVTKAETESMFFNPGKRGAQVEFFCRMKCSRFKVPNTVSKSPGFKVVHVSGSLKVMRGNHFLVTMVKPVSPASILEIRMEANMFVTHYNMDLKCIFFDGRMRHLLGYKKEEIEGRSPFVFQHHDDVAATAKCGKAIVERGESLSGYFRFLTQFGHYVWLQARGSLMHDSRTGKPSYIILLNYIISKDQGERDLEIRQAITANVSGISERSTRSYDPFPVLRVDNNMVNPLHDTSWESKFLYDDFDIEDYLTGKKERVDAKMEPEVVIKEEEVSFEQLNELKPDPDPEVQGSSHSLEQPGSHSLEQPGSHSSEQSGSHSLQQSGSHYGSASTVFSSSVGSPASSHFSPCESGYGSGVSPPCVLGSVDSGISLSSCSDPYHPDTSPNNSAISACDSGLLAFSPTDSDLTSDLQNFGNAAGQGSAITFSVEDPCFENQQLSVTDYRGRATSGPPAVPAPPRQASPEYARCPTGQAMPHVPLGEGLPSWENSNAPPPQIRPDIGREHSRVHAQQDGLGKGHFHGNTILTHALYMPDGSPVFQNGNGFPDPYQQQAGTAHGANFAVNYHTSCDPYTSEGTSCSKTLYHYDADASAIVPVNGPHQQVSFKQYSINASATVAMIDTPPLGTNDFNPLLQSPHTNHASELQILLSQQVAPSEYRNTALPDAPPPDMAGDIPQLTGEDLDILDLVA